MEKTNSESSVNTIDLATGMKEKYVAFLDVMGFKNLVYGRSYKQLDDYFNRVIEVLQNVESKEISSFMVSDSIILTAPVSNESLKTLIKTIRDIHQAMVNKKILIRGGLSKGNVFLDKTNNIIVGEGYIKAFFLEDQAIYPRVIIDPVILNDFNKSRSEFVEYMNGTDGYNFEDRLIYCKSNFSSIANDAIFIDYANKFIRKERTTIPYPKLYALIKENLSSEQSLYSKYTWLKEYILECLKLTKDTLKFTKIENSDDYLKKLDTKISDFENL